MRGMVVVTRNLLFRTKRDHKVCVIRSRTESRKRTRYYEVRGGPTKEEKETLS